MTWQSCFCSHLGNSPVPMFFRSLAEKRSLATYPQFPTILKILASIKNDIYYVYVYQYD